MFFILTNLSFVVSHCTGCCASLSLLYKPQRLLFICLLFIKLVTIVSNEFSLTKCLTFKPLYFKHITSPLVSYLIREFSYLYLINHWRDLSSTIKTCQLLHSIREFSYFYLSGLYRKSISENISLWRIFSYFHLSRLYRKSISEKTSLLRTRPFGYHIY